MQLQQGRSPVEQADWSNERELLGLESPIFYFILETKSMRGYRSHISLAATTNLIHRLYPLETGQSRNQRPWIAENLKTFQTG